MGKISSMTGFGRARGTVAGRELVVELKSVNSRHLDVKFRLPGTLDVLELTLGAHLRKRLSRGRVECSIVEATAGAEAAQIDLNWPLVRRYHDLFGRAAKELSLPPPGLEVIARQKDVLVTPPPPDPSILEEPLLALLDKAVAELQAAREREGADLARDIASRAGAIGKHMESVKANQPETARKLRERLLARLQEMQVQPDLDPQRFAQEVAYLADRADVSEEITRLESHIGRLRELLTEGAAVGRKLDFLVQEMNREANTIASKIASASVQHVVVEIKSEIERIREQVQNIE